MQPARYHGTPGEVQDLEPASDTTACGTRGFADSPFPAFLNTPPASGGGLFSQTPHTDEGGPDDPVYPHAGTRRLGLVRENKFQEQYKQMGKRSARFKKASREN